MIFTKKSKRAVSIITMLMFLLTLIPMGTAFAGTSGSLESLSAPTTQDDVSNTSDNMTTTDPNYGVDLGTVLIKTVAGAVYEGNTITLRLPSDYKWKNYLFRSDVVGADGWITGSDLANIINVPKKYSGDENGLYGFDFKVKKLSDEEIQIKADSFKADPYGDSSYSGKALSEEFDGYLYVYTKAIGIPSGASSGDITLIAVSPISQGFPQGEVVVGKLTGGEVLVTVDEVKTFTDNAEVTMRLKETTKGSFEGDSDTSMKLRLPNGFTWDLDYDGDSFSSVTGGYKFTNDSVMIWGDSGWITSAVTFTVDERDLIIHTTRATGGGTYFKLPVQVVVDDESVAKYGDVTVTFSGDTDAVPTSLVIAKYNEMGTAISAKDTTEVVAGKTDQEIGDVVIDEAAPGTLVKDRTITMTLPSNAKWYALPDLDYEDGIKLDEVGFVGSDGRTFKWKVNTATTTDAGKITFKDGSILLSGDASGKIEIQMGGTADVEGTVEVATVIAPVEATAASAPEVKIGLNDQPAGDMTIIELAAENIDRDDLIIVLPSGVEWSDVPTITVEEGDISLDEAKTSDNELTIPVKATSSTPATIKLSDIKLDIDRTVAEGDIYAKVQGLAVNEVNDAADSGTLDGDLDYTDGYWYVDGFKAFRDNSQEGAFPNVGTVAKAAIAKVVTPAPVDQKKSAKFVIGDTNFTVNGIEYTMDVAPYVKDGRTYLPVRFVAQALGVADSNILWDNATQKVTLIKGGTVVQLTIGSNVMLVNGAAITMDVPAEITSDRTMLPFRFIAQAFGATVGWDEATQTVTMDLM